MSGLPEAVRQALVARYVGASKCLNGCICRRPELVVAFEMALAEMQENEAKIAEYTNFMADLEGFTALHGVDLKVPEAPLRVGLGQ